MLFIVDGAAAYHLRRALAEKLQRRVTQEELATIVRERLRNRGVSTRGVGRQSIWRLEKGAFRAVDLEMLNELVAFYGEHDLDASGLLRYVPKAQSDDLPGNLKPARIGI